MARVEAIKKFNENVKKYYEINESILLTKNFNKNETSLETCLKSSFDEVELLNISKCLRVLNVTKLNADDFLSAEMCLTQIFSEVEENDNVKEILLNCKYLESTMIRKTDVNNGYANLIKILMRNLEASDLPSNLFMATHLLINISNLVYKDLEIKKSNNLTIVDSIELKKERKKIYVQDIMDEIIKVLNSNYESSDISDYLIENKDCFFKCMKGRNDFQKEIDKLYKLYGSFVKNKIYNSYRINDFMNNKVVSYLPYKLNEEDDFSYVSSNETHTMKALEIIEIRKYPKNSIIVEDLIKEMLQNEIDDLKNQYKKTLNPLT